jgi:hypothetical protein
MPGQPGPNTTVIDPAGASTAPSLSTAWRAASAANRRQRPSSRKKSKVTRPPPPYEPISRLPPSSAIAVTFSRVSGRVSPTVQPDAVAMSMMTSSLEIDAMTCFTRGSAARVSASIFRSRSSLRESSAAIGGSVRV